MEIAEDAGTITVRAPGKLNLFLEVLGRRPDGYHELATIMQAVTVYDELTFESSPGGITLATESPDVPHDRTNLVVKAAEILREHAGKKLGAKISLKKRIAVGSGMGGGSSDAAAALAGLNRLWKLGLAREELRQLAAKVGSDVAFFLYGGTALCRGRGEIVEPLSGARALTYVIVTPGVMVSTKEVYENCQANLTKVHEDYKLVIQALTQGDAKELPPFFNRLESVTTRLYPALRLVSDKMSRSGLHNVTMTGSGSAFFGIAAGRKEALGSIALLTQLGIEQAVMAQSIP